MIDIGVELALLEWRVQRWMRLFREHWRICRENANYAVSSDGRVKRIVPGVSTREGKVIRGSLDKGYRKVLLSANGEVCSHAVHRLVARAFLGEPPTEDAQVNHKNGRKWDNRVENLEWVTRQANIEHARLTLGRRVTFPGT